MHSWSTVFWFDIFCWHTVTLAALGGSWLFKYAVKLRSNYPAKVQLRRLKILMILSAPGHGWAPSQSISARSAQKQTLRFAQRWKKRGPRSAFCFCLLRTIYSCIQWPCLEKKGSKKQTFFCTKFLCCSSFLLSPSCCFSFSLFNRAALQPPGGNQVDGLPPAQRTGTSALAQAWLSDNW